MKNTAKRDVSGLVKMKTLLLITTLAFLSLNTSAQSSTSTNLSAPKQTAPKKVHKTECKDGETNPEYSVSNSLFTMTRPAICKDGKWVEDVDAEKKNADENAAREKHRKDLVNGLISRVLTDKEMEEVLETGYKVLIPNSGDTYIYYCSDCVYQSVQSSDEVNLNKMFDDDLLQQFKLRLAAQAQETNKSLTCSCSLPSSGIIISPATPCFTTKPASDTKQ